eukprot:1150171-Pelagomonas_calceolata.AAC.2
MYGSKYANTRRRLMRKLDWEKGISVENPLVPPKSEEDQAVQAEAEAANASDAAAAKGGTLSPPLEIVCHMVDDIVMVAKQPCGVDMRCDQCLRGCGGVPMEG